MATGRPVVSTAVPDVVSNFSSAAQIARSPEEFVQHCRQAIENADAKALERGLKMVAENSWETIVAKLEGHVMDALRARKARPGGKPSQPRNRRLPARADLGGAKAVALERTAL
jgi:hypothetical protein